GRAVPRVRRRGTWRASFGFWGERHARWMRRPFNEQEAGAVNVQPSNHAEKIQRAAVSYVSRARSPSDVMSSCHATGSMRFLRLLQSLQAGTTLPRLDVPPRASGTR